MILQERFLSALNNIDLNLTETQKEKFFRYYTMICEWNEKMNLTNLTEVDDFVVKHLLDCAMVWQNAWNEKNLRVMDMGAGAGFPSIVLKILHEEIDLVMVDALQKRIHFLENVVQELSLQKCQCIHSRAEDLAKMEEYRESFDVVTARAVAKLPVLAEYCLPFVKIGGVFVAMKGAKFEEEFDEAKRALKILGANENRTELKRVKLKNLDDVRGIFYIPKEKSTPKKYPRKSGLPKKNPL